MIPLIIVILLLLGSALFSSSELAIMGVPKYVVVHFAQQHPRHRVAKLLIQLKVRSERTLIAVLIGNNLINVALSIYAARLGDTILSTVALTGASAFVITSISITMMILLFGEILPKVFATRYALRFSLFVTPLIHFVTYLLFPLVYILEQLIRLMNRFLGKSDDIVSKEVVNLFVEDGKKQGMFSNTEALIIHNFLEFGERSVESIFQHRTKLFALSQETTLEDAISQILDKPYSRIPIFEHDKDTITGLLTLRDALSLYTDAKNHQKKLKDFGLRNVAKVPITASIFDVFLDMKKHGWHFAQVIDEYGGTAGIITFEDILEDLVGSIRDESDLYEEGEIIKLDQQTLLVKGHVNIRDIVDTLQLEGFRIPDHLEDELTEEESVSYSILQILKDFAKKGDRVELGKLHLEVTKVNNTGDKIEQVKVTNIDQE